MLSAMVSSSVTRISASSSEGRSHGASCVLREELVIVFEI